MSDQQLPDYDIKIESRKGFIITKAHFEILLKKIEEFSKETGLSKNLVTGFLIDPGPMEVWADNGLTPFSNILTAPPKECDHDWYYNQGGTAGDYRMCRRCGQRDNIKPVFP